MLGLEINVVLAKRLYPRALLTPFTDSVELTDADKRVYREYAQAQRHKGFERDPGQLRRSGSVSRDPRRARSARRGTAPAAWRRRAGRRRAARRPRPCCAPGRRSSRSGRAPTSSARVRAGAPAHGSTGLLAQHVPRSGRDCAARAASAPLAGPPPACTTPPTRQAPTTGRSSASPTSYAVSGMPAARRLHGEPRALHPSRARRRRRPRSSSAPIGGRSASWAESASRRLSRRRSARRSRRRGANGPLGWCEQRGHGDSSSSG